MLTDQELDEHEAFVTRMRGDAGIGKIWREAAILAWKEYAEKCDQKCEDCGGTGRYKGNPKPSPCRCIPRKAKEEIYCGKYIKQLNEGKLC